MNPDVISSTVRKPEVAATEFGISALYTLGEPGISRKQQRDCYSSQAESKTSGSTKSSIVLLLLLSVFQ